MLTASQISKVARMHAQLGDRGDCRTSNLAPPASSALKSGEAPKSGSITIEMVYAIRVDNGERAVLPLLGGQKRLPNGWRRVRTRRK